MTTNRKDGFLIAALVLVAVLVGLHDVGSGSAFALAVIFPIVAKTKAQLRQQANPVLMAGQQESEATPWVLFDTQLYTDNVTTQLTFFQTAAVAGLNNMDAAGQLTDPQFFEVQFIGLDVLAKPAAIGGAATGAAAVLSDAWQLIFGPAGTTLATAVTPTWTFVMSGKNYGPFPLSFLHGSGGLHGSVGYGSTTADVATREAQTNSVPDGGFFVGGSWTISPSTGFYIQCNWPTAVDLGASRALRVWMLGTLHRKVL